MPPVPIQPVQIPLTVRTDVNALMTLIDTQAQPSMTTQGVKLDGHLWKIHIFRQSDNTIIIRLVDKGAP